MGTNYKALDVAEDRGSFSELLKKHDIPYPKFVSSCRNCGGSR